MFATLFNASTRKNASVADLYQAVGNFQGSWNLGIDFTVVEEERVNFGFLLSFVQDCHPQSVLDKLQWSDGSEIFSVKECYRRILYYRLRFFNEGIFHFNWETIWVKLLPLKIAFFMWLLVRNGVLTQDNLQRRGFKLGSRCVFCHLELESANHLFLSCSFTSRLWAYFCFTFYETAAVPNSPWKVDELGTTFHCFEGEDNWGSCYCMHFAGNLDRTKFSYFWREVFNVRG